LWIESITGMTHLPVTTVLKFLAGILLVQAVTAVQLILALHSEHPEIWLMLALFAVTTGFLAALWFSSIATHAAREVLSDAKERLSRERERILARAEHEKTKVIARERRRVQAKASLKVGGSIAAVLGLGALLLLTQFVGFGLLTLASGGGAVAGYLFRARQDRQRHRREEAFETPGGPEKEKLVGEEAGQASGLLPQNGTDAK
jgi:hypothetical protein